MGSITSYYSNNESAATAPKDEPNVEETTTPPPKLPLNPEDILPPPIFVDDLLNKDSPQRKVCEQTLFDRGYVIIRTEGSELGKDLQNKMKTLFEDRDTFFNSSSDVKAVSKAPDLTNMGYILIPKIREYIKLRPFEPELWPNDPPTFKTSFDNVFQILKAIAWETFLSVADFEGHQLGDAKTINAVEQWVGTKSSLSLIHYFPRESGTISPCDAHEDTGLITLGGYTSLSGLEMWDRLYKQWIKVEELAKPTDLIAFLGLKIPMFSANSKWKATTHRVEFDPTKERHSIVFLLDVAK
jgi:isopenicillin N synthase-like dioxygenase